MKKSLLRTKLSLNRETLRRMELVSGSELPRVRGANEEPPVDSPSIPSGPITFEAFGCPRSRFNCPFVA